MSCHPAQDSAKRHKGPTATPIAHRGTELEALMPSKPVSERVSLLLDTFFLGDVCVCVAAAQCVGAKICQRLP